MTSPCNELFLSFQRLTLSDGDDLFLYNQDQSCETLVFQVMANRLVIRHFTLPLLKRILGILSPADRVGGVWAEATIEMSSFVRLCVRHTFYNFRAFPDEPIRGLISNLVDIFIMVLPKPGYLLVTPKWIDAVSGFWFVKQLWQTNRWLDWAQIWWASSRASSLWPYQLLVKLYWIPTGGVHLLMPCTFMNSTLRTKLTLKQRHMGDNISNFSGEPFVCSTGFLGRKSKALYNHKKPAANRLI